MTVSIHQPHYLPWGPLLFKILSSNIHIILDDVEFSKGDFQNRNYVFDYANRKNILLTVPVKRKGAKTLINKKGIYGKRCLLKHQKTIQQLYSHQPYIEDIMDIYNLVLKEEYRYLADLNYKMLVEILKYLEKDIKIYRSSEFLISSKSSQRIIDLITEVHEDIYLTSQNSLEKYLDTKLLLDNGIKTQVFKYNFTHPEDFSSIFSILVKYGKSTSKYILSKGEIYE